MPRPKAKVSQQRIAHELGVSQALVSLALNERKEGIRAETYERIWERAFKLGYIPKGMQLHRTLAASYTQQIGFILRSPLRLFSQGNCFSHVQHGVHRLVEENHLAAIFLGAEDELDEERIKRLFSPGNPLMGVILMGEVAPRFLKQIRQRHQHVVAVAASYSGLCHSVVADEKQSVDMLVEHLFELGHRRIGWVGGNVDLSRHKERHAAFLDSLGTRGLEDDPNFHFYEKGGERADGMTAAKRLGASVRDGTGPTAVICFNGLMARGLVNGLRHVGMSIPGDVSVTAVDATRVVQAEEPRITAAHASPEELGYQAANLVLKSNWSAVEEYRDIVVPAGFFLGDSTGTAPRR
jgi:LacI family transcriptional regulator